MHIFDCSHLGYLPEEIVLESVDNHEATEKRFHDWIEVIGDELFGTSLGRIDEEQSAPVGREFEDAIMDEGFRRMEHDLVFVYG